MPTRLVCIIAAAMLTLGVVGCGGQSATKSYSGTIPTTRAGLVAAFPSDVRPLLTNDIPTSVIGALLRVRKSGPQTLVDWDSGGELYQGESLAYIDNWERITGWKVKDIAPNPDPGKVKAQVASGHPNFDFFETGGAGQTLLEEHQGLLHPLDMSLLGADVARFPKDAGIDWTKYRDKYWIDFGFLGAVITWDTRKWPVSGPHPTTPADLFNVKKFPGKRCFFKFPTGAGTLEYALLAAGVSPQHLYPLNTTLAFKKLDTIKSNIVWFLTGSEATNDIVNGECAMGVNWNGRPALALKSNPGLPIGVTWQQILLIDDGWAIPKGAAHAEAANSLLAYDFTARNQCRFLNIMGYGVPMTSSCINAFGQKWGVTLQHIKQAAAIQDDDYYTQHISGLIDQFNAWLTS